MGGNFRELDEVEQLVNKTFADYRSYPTHVQVVQQFSDKTFTEGGYAAKFVKVFTHESFQLYGMCKTPQQYTPVYVW